MVDVGSSQVLLEPCGTENGVQLVCISDASGAWLNVDSVDGFGRFERLEGNTVVYALEGPLLRVEVRTASAAEPRSLSLSFG